MSHEETTHPELKEPALVAIRRDGIALARFATAFTGSGSDGDAAARDTFVAAIEATDAGDPDALSRRRLFGAARRRCAKIVERRRRGTEDRPAGIRTSLAEVRPTEREALLLRYVAGLTYDDLAAACDVDVATVQLRVSRGLAHLAGASGLLVAPGGAPNAIARRAEVQSALSEIIDGLAPDDLTDFVSDDDFSRDLVHEAERSAELLRGLESDHRVDPSELAESIRAALARPEASGVVPAESPEAAGTRTAPMGTLPMPAAPATPPEATPPEATPPEAAPPEAAPPEAAPPKEPSRSGAPLFERLSPRGRAALVIGSALTLVGLAIGVSRSGSPGGEFSGAAWSGKVADVARAFGARQGLERCGPDRSACRPIERDDEIPAGSTLRTDGRTRAIIALRDGSRVMLDSGSELLLDGESPRRARLDHGSAMVDVAKIRGSSARIDVPLGFVETESTKMVVTSAGPGASVEVVRGKVRLVDDSERGVAVHAGEEGRLEPDGPPAVYPTAHIDRALEWSERAFAQPDPGERDLSGLGELRAQKPGEDRERKGAVALASHSTKVRIVGNVARTEIDEEFTNSTDDVLEGIFRFPLPPDAQIERLALDVDGHPEEGAFVDRERAAAIWRGAIVNAGGPKPVKEEIVWVPGPWRDPALLEWQRGGRFELRVYPIPKHGSRHVTLAYTQVLPPSGDLRRYVYPLPHDPSGSTRIGRFDLDVQVRGHDPKLGVVASGYDLRQQSLPEGVQALTFTAEGFSPSGDLAVEFALPRAEQEVTAWAYQPGPDEVAAEGAGYVALALRPKLPRVEDGMFRQFSIVVDSSRSMFGERYRRASELAARVVSEMDPDDRVSVLACDSTCRKMPASGAPGPELARSVAAFLSGVTPEGGSDVALAIRRGREAMGDAPRGALRVVYIGDGTPTIGPVEPAFLRTEIAAAVPRELGTVSAVAVGVDADVTTLGTIAEAGGGVVIPYVPGQSTNAAAYAVLGGTYGTTLADPEVELPDGLVAALPRTLGTIPAGGEALVFARMTQPNVSGTLRLRGKVGGAAFEQSYPIHVEATTAKGNAFVPRLWAAAKIAELEKEPDADSRKLAVELSGRFHVASRYTSLLVLESAAMLQAFGLDHAALGPRWTGEDDATSTGTDAELAVAEPEGSDDAMRERAANEAPRDTLYSRGDDKPSGSYSGLSALGGIGPSTGGAGRAGASVAAPAAAPSPEPVRPSAAPAEKKAARSKSEVAANAYESEAPFDFASPPPAKPTPPPQRRDALLLDEGGSGGGPIVQQPWERPRRMIPMRKVWDRVGRIVAPATLPSSVTPEAIAQAERDVQSNDNRRDAVRKLYTLYFLSGDVARASDVAERWSTRDPLDPDALTARADVAAARGDRDLAIRILGSVVDVRPGDHKAQWRLARLHRWAGRPELGCRHSEAVAQIRSTDATSLAEAVRCARDVGRPDLASDLLSAATEATRRAADALLVQPPADPAALSGDLRVEATWDGGDDLDLSMLPSDGNRVSWLGAPTKAVISARDVQSESREGLSLRGGAPGDYVIEVTRPAGHSGLVHGTATITAAGERRAVPFVLDGTTARIALVKITTRPRLVPL